MNRLTQRGGGVLCHISSLPNEYGIGSLGKEAYAFADWLKSAHVKYWQILPLAHTGYGDSPYSSACCNSGNPYFIDLEALRDEGLLDDEELASCRMPAGDVDYGELYKKRFDILRLAYARFNLKDEEFVAFENSGEFEDYAVFMSLKTRYAGSFDTFPDSYKYTENLAIKDFKATVYKSDYCFWLFLQFVFRKQWFKLKNYVNSLGISIIGDLPLYVAYDSSDVWANPELFKLDEELHPTEVAGVPPDYFSPTGQLWGNPVYNWELMESDGYDWWINRIKKASELYDIIRIDHFRGFDRYFAIPAGAHNAVNGEWEDGPGREFFKEVERRLGSVEILAEDLGIIDDSVTVLRQSCGFPGMNVLMFAFDGREDNAYLPANIVENSVTYTGTHDNDTALGYLEKMSDAQFKTFKKQLRKVLKAQGAYRPLVDRKDVAQALCVCAAYAKSYITVLPVQDVMCLDNSARMNVPATSSGNWRFRLSAMPSRKAMAELKNLIKESNR